MIIRAALAGFVLWLAGILLFRLAGQSFFYPDATVMLALLFGAPVVMVVIAWAAMKLLRVARGDEAEAAIGLALPGMVLDVFAVREFVTLFPNLDPTLDADFGALMLAGYAAVVFAGILFTKLAPQDERL